LIIFKTIIVETNGFIPGYYLYNSYIRKKMYYTFFFNSKMLIYYIILIVLETRVPIYRYSIVSHKEQ